LALFLLISSACDDSTLDVKRDTILGRWNWQQSSGGLAGIINTPESVGYSIELEFNENGIYTLYVADTIQEQGNYNITKELSVFSNDPVPTITYENRSIPQAILKLNKDSLLVADECLDCFLEAFIRISDGE